MFETENLLGPLAPDENENVLKVSKFHWDNGLSRDLLVFHTGLCLSASSVDTRRHRNRLVVLSAESYESVHWFETFNDWYQQTVRSEYARRYGLAL